MRSLLVWFAIASLAFGGVAFEAGRRAEREYRAALGALGDHGRLALSIRSYRRGWLRSEAVTWVGPSALPDGAERTVRLVLHHQIDHGPFPLSLLTSGRFDGRPVLAYVVTVPTIEIEDAEEIAEVPIPVSLEALFTRSQGATLRIVALPDAAGFDDPELAGDWTSIRAETRVAYDGSQAAGEIEVPRIGFAGELGAFQLEGLRADFDLRRAPGAAALLTGRSRLGLGRLAFGEGAGAFSLRDLRIEQSSQLSRGAWSLGASGSFGRLTGGAPISDGGELLLRLDGIAVEPLAELQQAARRLELEGPAGEAATPVWLSAAGALWPRLMAAGPELEISRLRIATPDGELRMTFRAGIDPSDRARLANPLTTLPALEVDLELSLPEALLERWLARPRPVPTLGAAGGPWTNPAEAASRHVEAWLEHGYLARNRDRYVTSVRIRRGIARLNGRLVSIESL